MATKRYNFKFHCEKDADIISVLDSKENMQDYIRSLVRADAIISQLIASDPMLAIEEELNNESKTD